jgi:hypothetical protein
MGSYLSTNATDSMNHNTDQSNKNENKEPIIMAKFPAPSSSMIGWSYCLIYPADENGVHQMESSTMGVLYRSTLPFQETHYLKYLDQMSCFNVYKPTLQGVRGERIKFTPLTEKEQAHMEKVINEEVEYI